MKQRSHSIEKLLQISVTLLILAASVFAVGQERYIAVTFDDLPFVPLKGEKNPASLKTKTVRLIHVLKSNNIPSLGFVNAGKLFKNGRLVSHHVELLRLWLEAGLELGNHTYSHKDLHNVPWQEFKQDVIKGETIIKDMLKTKGMSIRYFRHPCLHTGHTPELKKKCQTFLASRGYTVAPVTIDNSDWIFALAFNNALGRHDTRLMKRIVDAYIPYMEQKLEYYEKQSQDLLGHPVKQVLLLHANTLNALHLDRLVQMIKKRGYTFISLEHALKDNAYGLPDEYSGREGISWIHRWAITMGKRGDFFHGEPPTPAFVMKAAGVESE
jgi:peptidoglycan/xylan/chitin deacetylase (PgdA/CDA1 family)